MLKESFKIATQVIAIIVGYFLLSLYLSDLFIVIGAIVFAIPITIISFKTKSGFEYYLEALCDPDRYLQLVKGRYTKKSDSVYKLYLAYAYVYQGDYENASLIIEEVDSDSLNEVPKLNLIYYFVLLELAYNNNDIDKFETLHLEVKNIELDKTSKIEIKLFDVLSLMIQKNYSEAIELLMDLIPKQKRRFLVMELEYYLALAYIETKKTSDATAVLEFIGNKRYHLIYNVKGRELLENYKK